MNLFTHTVRNGVCSVKPRDCNPVPSFRATNEYVDTPAMHDD
jgi:hypothetical protein